MAKSAKQAILETIDKDIADLQRARALVAAHGEGEEAAPARKARKPRKARGLPPAAHEQ